MRKIHSLIILVALGALLAGCGTTLADSVRGSGKSVTETRTISGFSEVVLAGSGNLIIEQTGSESLTITAEDNILPYLTSDVNGGRLVLGARPNTSFRPTQNITYRLTVRDLEGLELSGSGNVTASAIDTDQMTIRISGSGDITASGNTDRQDVTIAGSGSYKAENLTSAEASVLVSGSGQALVNASEQLDARVSGSGNIFYVGNPAVTQSITGSGAVRPR